MRVVTPTLSYLLVLSLSVGCAYVPTTSLRYDPVATAYAGQPRHSVAVLPLEHDRNRVVGIDVAAGECTHEGLVLFTGHGVSPGGTESGS